MLNFFFDGVPPLTQPGDDVIARPETPAHTSAQTQDILPAAVPPMVQHEPFALGDCSDCHSSKGSQKVRRKEPSSCYGCHGKMLKKLTVIHEPAGEGNCKSCHAAHESPWGNLLHKPEKQLCNDCHDPVDTLPVVHDPVVKGKCSVCHSSHGSKHPFVLLKSENSLCYDCHKKADFAHTDAHRDIETQACSVCHDPHQSRLPDLLKLRRP